jgi:PleD family two-component response regulator
MKILIVDDFLDSLLPIIYFIKKAGHELTECFCPLKALDLIENQKFDCIITDYSMTEMNGIELAVTIRNNPNPIIAETPILLLTGLEESELVDTATAAGIDLFKTKGDVLTQPRNCIYAIESAIQYNKMNIAKNQLLTAYKQGK